MGLINVSGHTGVWVRMKEGNRKILRFPSFILTHTPVWPETLINPMNTQANQLIDGQIFYSVRLQACNEVGSHSVNAHGNQLIRLWMRVSQLLKLADKIRRHSMNAERDELVEIQDVQPRRANP